MDRRVICFGDSNTWGYDAEYGTRFSEKERWPCLLQQYLGRSFQVIEEGLPGRTGVVDDPLSEGLNGYKYLTPCLKSHAPVEILIIMLGTNDTKERFNLTAYNIAQGITRLALKAKEVLTEINKNPFRILVVAPPPIGQGYKSTAIRDSMGKDCDLKSEEFPRYLQEMLAENKMEFLDAKEHVTMNSIDYMHLNRDGHELLAKHNFKKLVNNQGGNIE